MLTATALPAKQADEQTAHWGGVFAMSLCVFALIASEFMPVSLLTPIAADLAVTEGRAGLAIAVSGAFAVITSLSISTVARNINRKTLLLLLTVLMAVSGTTVAVAPNYPIFMIGRALIGVVIGGFWSMSAAIAMRLVPEGKVPRALAIFNAGNALATVIAPPLGSFLGSLIGWRGAFFAVVPVAMVVFLWQWAALPPMKSDRAPRTGNPFAVLRRPIVAFGMVSVGVFFMGQFALFTFVRPFLETVTRADVSMLSTVLLVIGAAGFVGTSAIGSVLKRSVYPVLIVIPALMAGLAALLIVLGSDLRATTALFGLWGLLATAAPVGWWTWLARSLPQDAEAGGGLMVAIIQLAITLGAVVGGLLYDSAGYRGAFGTSALLLIIGAVLAYVTSRYSRAPTPD